MKFESTPLQGSYIIELLPFNDDRGWLVRTYCKEEFEKMNLNGEWVQMNHSSTIKTGTIRGMHYQLPPYKEIKLVRCIRGQIYDVIVDIRKDSPTFLKWFGVILSPDNWKMLYIPEGFAHGFQTMTDDCELLYMHSALYQPGSENGIKYNDTRINIEWPLPVKKISMRDSSHLELNENFKGI